MKWYSKSFSYGMELAEFLNKNNIKPENCKITESVQGFMLFYYK